ncbi:MAG: cytidine deaminase [Prevotella sp.]
MEAKTITAKILVAQMCELPADDVELIESAINQTEKSYSPYSKFNVGAAIRLENGETVLGCNQENVAFGVAMCAERSALFAAGAKCPEMAVTTIAIAARDANGLLREPISPCGVCRQAMVETETRYNRRLRILLYGTEKIYIIDGIAELMPLTFSNF